MVENKEQTAFSLSSGALVCELSGEIDHHAARTVREAVDGELYRACPSELVLDFTRVGFMDSSGIALIIGRAECARELGIPLRVVGLSRIQERLIRLSGVDRIEGVTLKGADA